MNIQTKFVRIGRKVPGVLYEPADAAKRHPAAVLVMHSDEDYLTCPTGEELARRGHVVLCANVEVKEGIIFHMHEKMHCVSAALTWLKDYPGVKKVILMGHSGGATLMSAYQAVAENGPRIFQGDEVIYPYPDDEALPPADGIMLLDANWGNSVMQVFSLDPAVRWDDNGMDIDPEYDLFNPENGFRKGGSEYSPAFTEKFQKEQSRRNRRILSSAMERLSQIEAGKGLYEDDEPLSLAGAAQSFFCNKLFAQDPRLLSHTQDAWPQIYADGSIRTEVVHTVRHPENDISFTANFREGARLLTVRTFLSSYAIRTEENFGYDASHVWGIDWTSAYSAPPGNMTHIKAPTLVMGMTGGWEFMAAETIYRMSAAEDKTIAFVRGASHKFKTAQHCESYPGEFGDTMALLHDYAAAWLKAGRF